MDSGSLFASVEAGSDPCANLIGTINLPAPLMEDQAIEDKSSGNLCSYGLGQRWQYWSGPQGAASDAIAELAGHRELKAFALQHSQQTLGCQLNQEDIKIQARRCVDQSDYYFSPHADCPKTVCAFIIYLWTGSRGTSLYSLTGYSGSPPAAVPGLQERSNNFTGRRDYQRENLDVVTSIKPDCFAYFEHVKTIAPVFGSFLFIPNTRFRQAFPDLPPSYHGVSSKLSDRELDERRNLILIDVKISERSKPGLGSRIKARIKSRLKDVQLKVMS